MSSFLEELLATPPFFFGLLALVLGILLLVLLARLRRAQDAASFLDLGSGLPPEPGGGDDEPVEVVDLRGADTTGRERSTASRVVRLLDRLDPGPGSRYRMPWFLCLGQVASGKTTLLGETDLRLPFGEPHQLTPADGGEAEPVGWWIYDSAVVLDTDGRLVLDHDGTSSDQPAWLGVLRMLRRRRHRRPADGVVLTVPVTELLDLPTDDRGARGRLGQRAELLRRRLDQAQRELDFTLPVWVVVTQCDLVPGFGDLLDELGPEARREMIGWSNATPPDVPYSSAWTDDAVESVVTALDRIQLHHLDEGVAGTTPRRYLALPAAVESCREPLRILLNRLFARRAGSEAPPLRGIYLTVGEGFDQPGEDSPHRWPAAAGAAPAPEGHRHVHFLSDLFHRKILAEWDLARPTEAALDLRRRLVTAGRLLLVALLVAGPVLLGWSAVTLNRHVRTLRSGFVEPAGTALGDPQDEGEAIETLLAGAGRVSDYTLRFAFLPPSWWSDLADDTVATGRGVYRRVVFPTTLGRLEARRERLGATKPPGTPSTPVYDLPSVPGFEDLETLVAGIDQLEEGITLYGRFAAPCNTDPLTVVTRFARLTAPYFRTAFSPPEEAREFYWDVLCELDGLPAYSGPIPDRKLATTTLTVGSAVLDDLYKSNVVVDDLELLERRIDHLARQVPPASEVPKVYHDLVQLIDRTADDLADPRVAWMGKDQVDLGERFETVLRHVGTNALLGRETQRLLALRSRAGFEDLKAHLRNFRTGATGPLLARDKDGAPTLALSESVSGLRTALATLVEGYPSDGAPPATPVPTPGGRYLIWEVGALTEAGGTLASYKTFLSGNFQSYPGFAQIVAQATRGGVEAEVLDQVAYAQRFEIMPELSSPARIEAHLDSQVENLLAAAKPLGEILGNLTVPPEVTGCRDRQDLAYCTLAAVIRGQQEALLGELTRLLASQTPYVPAAGGFTGWDGERNLALEAFGVSDAKALEAYVTSQRTVVQTLESRYARAILTAVTLQEGAAGGASLPETERWEQIGKALTAYQNQTPGNPLAGLEGFITGTLATASLDDCLDVEASGRLCPTTNGGGGDPPCQALPPAGCDLFAQRRICLEQATRASCETATLTAGRSAYATLRQAFGGHLAGHYPFAVPAAASTQPATPGDLAAFFTVYDAQRPLVENLLTVRRRSASRNPPGPAAEWPEGTEAELVQFLTRMDGVRSFFATFLAERAAAVEKGGPGPLPVPEFGVAVDLRPSPTAERGGEAVIARTLTTTDATVTYPLLGGSDGAPSPTWSYDGPLALAFRWAADGPIAPEKPQETSGVILDGRTVTYRPSGPWALLRLILEHPGPDGAGVGRLVFEVPTSETSTDPARTAPCLAEKPAGDQPPEASDGGTGKQAAAPVPACLTVRLVPTTPGESPEELTVPPFPATAPALPKGTGQTTGGGGR